ncbi:hypothetical protein BDV93DRAFT_533865 [Ceratobasidium sp. AG-I]|nr:hypothetical protein BDV93DRAFT_533865 [Ceratobasidium sp. AG-I]
MPLDESLYSLSPDEREFFRSTTGISDESELKRHIIDIQTEAYNVFPYPCIRRFMFTKFKVSSYPVYAHVVEYGRTHPGAIFLEMACFFGIDARKAALDGYPTENIVATDLHEEFWDLGFKLFKDSPSTFPVPFLGGDILSSDLLDLNASKSSARPNLSSLTSLTDLLGHVSFIHASAFFHLFSEENQQKIAQRCRALLSNQPGSTVFGFHFAAVEPGIYSNMGGTNYTMFCHSPQSWEKLWKELYGETPIKVVATLEAKIPNENASEAAPGSNVTERRPMVWSITLL